ncbi:hypothetical protein QYF61_019707 [Mycteria americana]|uniref:Uncharacterized protein n=1 Tax=Mycteria americana TaxID=33587 RepID=A0AAN7N7P4_MYCAM|nr:hypothetical protein QYF61_019707 [Mycteria americana]
MLWQYSHRLHCERIWGLCLVKAVPDGVRRIPTRHSSCEERLCPSLPKGVFWLQLRLVIGSTAEYHHQINSGVLISTFTHFGYRFAWALKGWQQRLAAIAPISRHLWETRKEDEKEEKKPRPSTFNTVIEEPTTDPDETAEIVYSRVYQLSPAAVKCTDIYIQDEDHDHQLQLSVPIGHSIERPEFISTRNNTPVYDGSKAHNANKGLRVSIRSSTNLSLTTYSIMTGYIHTENNLCKKDTDGSGQNEGVHLAQARSLLISLKKIHLSHAKSRLKSGPHHTSPAVQCSHVLNRSSAEQIPSLKEHVWIWSGIGMVHSKGGRQMQSVSDLCIRELKSQPARGAPAPHHAGRTRLTSHGQRTNAQCRSRTNRAMCCIGWRLNHFPGQPVPILDNPFSEVKFPNIQSKPPLVQLEAISSCPVTCYLGEETDPHLSTTSFQAKQIQFPQPLLIRVVLQALHQLCCPSLDSLQHLNVSLVARGPKLNTAFKVRPHQCRVQGHNHFPSPAGHAIFDTSQDAIGFLGHLGTLLAHIQVAVNQHSQVLLCWAAFQPLFPKPVALHGVAAAQVQDLALSLVEPHTIDLGPSIQHIQTLPTLKQINTPTQLGVTCKLTEGALDPLVQIIDKDIKQDWPQHRALGNTACDRPPTGVNSIHHHSLGPAIQPVLYPEKSTPVQAMSSQFLQENAVGNRVKGFTEV